PRSSTRRPRGSAEMIGLRWRMPIPLPATLKRRAAFSNHSTKGRRDPDGLSSWYAHGFEQATQTERWRQLSQRLTSIDGPTTWPRQDRVISHWVERPKP